MSCCLNSCYPSLKQCLEKMRNEWVWVICRLLMYAMSGRSGDTWMRWDNNCPSLDSYGKMHKTKESENVPINAWSKLEWIKLLMLCNDECSDNWVETLPNIWKRKPRVSTQIYLIKGKTRKLPRSLALRIDKRLCMQCNEWLECNGRNARMDCAWVAPLSKMITALILEDNCSSLER